MSTRTVSTVLLFFVAMAITALGLAVMTTMVPAADASLGGRLLPVMLFANSVAVFLIGRTAVLPPPIASRAGLALVVLMLAVALSLGAAYGLRLLLAPARAWLGGGPSAAVIWLVCVLLSFALVERIAAWQRRR